MCLFAEDEFTKSLKRMGSERVFYKNYVVRNGKLYSPFRRTSIPVANENDKNKIIISDRKSKVITSYTIATNDYGYTFKFKIVNKGIHVYRSKIAAVNRHRSNDVTFKVIGNRDDLIGASETEAAFMKVKLVGKA